MKKRIAIDMDEVLVNTAATHLLRYNETFSTNLTSEELFGISIYDAIPPEHIKPTRAILEHPEFFESPAPMPGSQDVMVKLIETYEVFVATAAMEFPTSFAAKYKWMQKHFPMFPASNIVFCGDKSILKADFLIDDTPRHFQRFGGEGIIFTALHNVHETGFRRVDNWQEVQTMFLPDTDN